MGGLLVTQGIHLLLCTTSNLLAATATIKCRILALSVGNKSAPTTHHRPPSVRYLDAG
ncbi:hypothetical protein BDD12DRAFT_811192 [Trichophaea hybrida]|nr:hypothetical protein BDD12DRAFT_811192 [Trichophaea hybrida]